METKLERIAAKARKEIKLRFTSLAHHITRELIMSKIFSIVREEQAAKINQILRGHYAYYGVAGNFQSLYVDL
ncbi:MAG: hypothetical protein SVV67_10655 [Bacillota bacterium]|nr:hypothetical protein [Bacillota bacterium]